MKKKIHCIEHVSSDFHVVVPISMSAIIEKKVELGVGVLFYKCEDSEGPNQSFSSTSSSSSASKKKANKKCH
jgi:hypothetical protein